MVCDHWYSGADGGILAVTPDDFRSHGGWAPESMILQRTHNSGRIDADAKGCFREN